MAVADGILDFGWFSLSLSPWSSQRVWTGAIVAGGALYLHLVNASHLAGRRACLIACIVPVVIGGGSLWLSERQAWRDVNQIGTRLRIYPPALRLRTAGPLDDYFKIAGDLRDAADKKRKAAIAEDVKDGIEY